MTVICTGDLHFNTNPHDEYRWGIIDWLCENSKGVDELIFVGDYTGPKDSHPGLLVNRFKESVDKLRSHFSSVYILYGNHDGLTQETAFWKFLNGMRDNVHFIDRPSYAELSIGKVLFLPAGIDWSLIQNNGITKYIFTHATFEGAISETGYQLTGVPLSHAERIGIPIISGDIHKPQIIGDFIEYVGAPYHIRFGDQYQPRVMHIDNEDTRSNLYYPAPQKKVYNIRTLEDFEKLPIDDKQHAKIRVHLDRGSLTEWPLIQSEIKARASEAGLMNIRPELVLKPEVSSTGHRSQDIKSPEQLVSEYADRHNASERHIEIGKSLL
jgi:DNA repair exonuclease SbcCD nuclease subunit